MVAIAWAKPRTTGSSASGPGGGRGVGGIVKEAMPGGDAEEIRITGGIDVPQFARWWSAGDNADERLAGKCALGQVGGGAA